MKDYIYYCEKLLHRIDVAKRLGKKEMEVSIASVEYPKCSQMGRVPMSVIEGIEKVLQDYIKLSWDAGLEIEETEEGVKVECRYYEPAPRSIDVESDKRAIAVLEKTHGDKYGLEIYER